VEDGTVVVRSDGRMQTTWKLRPDVKWHDGVQFTAEDLVFAWQVMSSPEIASPGSSIAREIESVEATDALTAIFTWRRPFYRGIAPTINLFWPYPKHLIGEAFQGDISGFLNHPYFTSGYVHLGPFRLADFGLGEQQIFERFDDYFLGRPKVDRVVIRTIPDPGTLIASLQARGIDMAAEKTMSIEAAKTLSDQWSPAGDGRVVTRLDNWRYAWFQFRPEYGRPPELSRDARTRRGLLDGLDRPAMGQVLLAGITPGGDDTFVPPADSRAALAGQPYSRYPYDPTRAAQELAAAGWQRGPDGRLLNQDGQQVEFEARASSAFDKDLAIMADYWRKLGAAVNEHVVSETEGRDNEYKATFSGVEISSRTLDGFFTTLDSRQLAGPANRWTSGNKSGYSNPSMDRLIDGLEASLNVQAQGQVLKEIGELMADGLPALPVYLEALLAAVGRGVIALDDYAGTADTRTLARNAHLWDRQ
jgi:peptide/nickel transport system substrate-binding protein